MNRSERGAVLGLLGPGLLIFLGIVVAPLLMTVLLSFNSYSLTRGIDPSLSLANYADIFSDVYFAGIFLRTLRVTVAVTALCVLLGVPEAYILHRMRSAWRGIFLLVIIGPLLISVVARTLGWTLALGSNGLLSLSLQRLGLSDGPVSLMFTETGVIIAMVHLMVPFVVLSVWASLARVDTAAERAALSLGASPWVIFRRIVLPQIVPGILSGAMIAFSLTASAFATPAIVGGRRLKLASTLIYDEFLYSLNWPLGAAVALVLLVGIAALVIGCNRLVERRYAQVFG